VTPEQVELVRDCLTRLHPKLEAIADDFYTRLFADQPALRELFPDDLSAQRIKFSEELETILLAIPDFARFRSRAAELGRRHVAYGVRRSNYATLRHHLLAAVANADPDWNDELASAWRLAYDLVAELMQSSAGR
jgi:hemoglobin-like flavoprotein